MKHLLQNTLKRLKNPDNTVPDHEYEYWVNLTAKMLKKPYIAVHKMVERWPLDKIRDRYNEATKHNGKLPKDVYWFWRRKQDKEKKL